MRITLVSPFDPNPPAGVAGSERVGGVERVFAEVSQRLARRGHDVTLVCSTSAAPTSTNEHGVAVVRRRRRGTLLKAPLVRLARDIQSTADIVHVAATYPFTTPAVLRRAHALGIPSVLDFHFEPAPGTALGKAAASLYRHIGPRDYPLAAVTLVRSLAYGRRSPSLDGVLQETWRVVPNGIDPARFNADGPTRPGDYLLFVGRLVPYKGVDVLFDALSLLALDVPLVVAGRGPLERILRAKAAALGLDVTFLGHVPDDDLPALYRGARITILPSVTGQECFGISLLESMACGTPVVASRLPGVSEVAALGGLLADPGDAASLARQIREALQPGVLPRGPPLAAAIHAKFSWDAVTDQLEAIYHEITTPGGLVGPAKEP